MVLNSISCAAPAAGKLFRSTGQGKSMSYLSGMTQ